MTRKRTTARLSPRRPTSWGTDGVRVFTAEDGWVWTFAAVDHWNCRVRGLAVQGGEPLCGPRADRARARATLRLGRGGRGPPGWRYGWTTAASICQTTSSTRSATGASTTASASSKSRNQRGRRALESHEEQAIYGRVFHNLAEVRAAVAAFVERYNQCWRLEKLAYRTPLEAREEYELRHAA